MRMGIAELAVILAIVMLLFGAKRLPQLADGMGKAIRNFKRGMSSPEDDVSPDAKQLASAAADAEIAAAAGAAREPTGARAAASR